MSSSIYRDELRLGLKTAPKVSREESAGGEGGSMGPESGTRKGRFIKGGS